MKFISKLFVVHALLATSGLAMAAATPEEVRTLGNSLTPVGAEKAGNKDGTIPEYTGGLVALPASYKAGGAMRPDPFDGEKPQLSISGKNMAEYADKLTEGTKALLTKNAGYRIDVYPTHRTVTFPKVVLDNTMKNASRAQATDGGVGLQGAVGGFPFPVPHSGAEVIWNHLMQYKGHAIHLKYDSWNVDSAGVPTLSTTGDAYEEYPYYAPDKTEPAKEGDLYFKLKLYYQGPARRAGEALMAFDAVNPLKQPRRAWQYLPGQRRVKVAPDINYDTPNPGTAGTATYDDAYVFNGAMDRYSWKLVGKKEIYIPYNDYRLMYHDKAADITTPNFVNPDLVRWELHRVWVVEATLNAGKRHIYSKRVFYVDEDSWIAVASDQYDSRSQLYRASFAFPTFSYDVLAPNADDFVTYDFVAGNYAIVGLSGIYGGLHYIAPLPASQWAADALAGSGIR